MDEYVIVGDTERYKGCLLFTCGSSLEHATHVLERLLYNPSEMDLELMKGHTNIRLEKCERKDCWWHWGCD